MREYDPIEEALIQQAATDCLDAINAGAAIARTTCRSGIDTFEMRLRIASDPEHPVCHMPVHYGRKYVGEGVCCVTGCERPHYVGGADEKGRPKRKFDTRHECHEACVVANQV